MPKPEELFPPTTFLAFANKFAAWAVETKLGWERYRDTELEKTPLKHAVKFLGETPITAITKDRIKDFAILGRRLKIGGLPVKNRTANGYVKDILHVFNKAIEWGDAVTNPVSSVMKFKFADEQRQQSAGRVLETEQEQWKLMDTHPSWLRLMVAIGLETGARRGDLVKLTWESVHPDFLEFCETKECRHRAVALSHKARTILAALRPKNAKPDAYVFEPTVARKTLVSRIRREWDCAVNRSGVAKIRFHDLRHTVGTRLVRNAVDLRTVQSILGHASLKTTERYLHSSDKLKQATVETPSSFGRCLPAAAEESVRETVAFGNRIN